jgi:WhiB family transcriptional regulator, redox-sensing transcriptional regulator
MLPSHVVSKAACRGTDPDALFVQGAAQNRAKQICRGCRVRAECLADALDGRIEFGVWGGMTERERRALLRRRPEVTSWYGLLMSARDQYERADLDATDDGADDDGAPEDRAPEDRTPEDRAARAG